MLLLPIVPFLSAVGMAVSACTMVWYRTLNKVEKEHADHATAAFAKQLYGKCFGKSPLPERPQDVGEPQRLN